LPTLVRRVRRLTNVGAVVLDTADAQLVVEKNRHGNHHNTKSFHPAVLMRTSFCAGYPGVTSLVDDSFVEHPSRRHQKDTKSAGEEFDWQRYVLTPMAVGAAKSWAAVASLTRDRPRSYAALTAAH